MTDKEKLVALLCEAMLRYDRIKDDRQDNPFHVFADHLIANGVTVPNRGHWVIHSNGRGSHATNWAECSECHVCGSPHWKVCPVCETKMEDT